VAARCLQNLTEVRDEGRRLAAGMLGELQHLLQPLDLQLFAPVKALPVIVTTVPTQPQPGENPLTTACTLNDAALVVLPAGVVTPILPVVPRLGTVAVISVCGW